MRVDIEGAYLCGFLDVISHLGAGLVYLLMPGLLDSGRDGGGERSSLS